MFQGFRSGLPAGGAPRRCPMACPWPMACPAHARGDQGCLANRCLRVAYLVGGGRLGSTQHKRPISRCW